MLYLLINTHVVLSAASFIEREGLGSAAQAFWLLLYVAISFSGFNGAWLQCHYACSYNPHKGYETQVFLCQ